MGKCYSIAHFAEDYIHADIPCNTEKPQKKYRLGTVNNRLLKRGGGGIKHVLKNPKPRGVLNMFYRIRNLALSFAMVLNIWSAHEGFQIHQ